MDWFTSPPLITVLTELARLGLAVLVGVMSIWKLVTISCS